MRAKWWVLGVVLLGACASLPAASSGKIGCPENEITITDDNSGWSSRTWTAWCRGKRFFCTATQTGKDTSDISCTPEQAPAPPPAPPPPPVGGCNPPCSPGYQCQQGACAPLCNPACGAGMVCAADRTCQPASPAAQ
jgi:hypothetical protein